jgi:hypothetical protein
MSSYDERARQKGSHPHSFRLGPTCKRNGGRMPITVARLRASAGMKVGS